MASTNRKRDEQRSLTLNLDDARSLGEVSKTVNTLVSAFEAAARQSDFNATQYWRARDLAQLLGYADFRNFQTIVEKAKVACSNSGQATHDHFVDVTEMVVIGSGAEREIADVALSRYACYLTAQNADSRKHAVAVAQTYFATQTRRQEIADEVEREPSNDEKRVLLRTRLREHNKSLAQAAKTAGVKNFANFNGAGLKGLYGGLNKAQVVSRKGLSVGSEHLDHAGHEELAANYFKATQAEAKLRRETADNGEIGQRKSETIHRDVGSAVRETIVGLGNAPPEALPAEDHIRNAQKRVKSVATSALPRATGAAPQKRKVTKRRS